jgi:hypothetical protein
MRKNIEAAARYVEFIKRVSEEVIQPFKEKPSTDNQPKPKGNEKDSRLEASDLFSLFTADIIKEKAVFTR